MKAEVISFISAMIVAAVGSYFLLFARAKKAAMPQASAPQTPAFRPQGAQSSGLSTFVPQLIRLVVWVGIAYGGYVGYQKFFAAPPPPSDAYLAFSKFSELWIREDFSSATQYATGEAKHMAEVETAFANYAFRATPGNRDALLALKISPAEIQRRSIESSAKTSVMGGAGFAPSIEGIKPRKISEQPAGDGLVNIQVEQTVTRLHHQKGIQGYAPEKVMHTATVQQVSDKWLVQKFNEIKIKS